MPANYLLDYAYIAGYIKVWIKVWKDWIFILRKQQRQPWADEKGNCRHQRKVGNFNKQTSYGRKETENGR